MNLRDYVIYELFRPEPSDIVASFRIIRRASTLDVLIDNRAHWSPTLNSFTVIYQEMADILKGINRDLAVLYPQYKSEDSQMTFLEQEYRPFLLLNFLQSGKQFFQETIAQVEKEIDDTIPQKKQKLEKSVFESWFERALDRRPSRRLFNWISLPDMPKIPETYGPADAELLKKIYNEQKNSSIVLSMTMWEKFKKSESFSTISYEKLDQAEAPDRNYQKLAYDAIEMGQMTMPIVILRNGAYHVMAGETTLRLCRAAKITPRIIVLEICCVD